MITQQSWMFLKSFADFRSVSTDKLAQAKHNGEFTGLLRETSIETLAHLGSNAFEEIGGEVVQSTMFTLAKVSPYHEHNLVAVRLVGFKSSSKKASVLQTNQVLDDNAGIISVIVQSDLVRVDTAPLVYWLGRKLINVLVSATTTAFSCMISEGAGTRDETRFIRFHWEVCDLSRHLKYSKGGGYKKWHGFETTTVDWRLGGALVIQSIVEKYPYLNGNVSILIHDRELYGMEGLSYTDVGRGSLSCRGMINSLFSDQGPGIFARPPYSLYQIAASLNSRLTSYYLRALTPNPFHLRKGYIYEVPLAPINPHLGTYCMKLASMEDQSLTVEYSFRVDSIGNNSEIVVEQLHALRHSVEAVIEDMVFQSLDIETEDIARICSETGVPVGWHPLIVDYDSLPNLPSSLDLPLMPREAYEFLAHHERIAPHKKELARIKANLQALYEVGPGAKTDDLELEDLDHQGGEDDGVSVLTSPSLPKPFWKS